MLNHSFAITSPAELFPTDDISLYFIIASKVLWVLYAGNWAPVVYALVSGQSSLQYRPHG
jgi:hypothetical protein